ncbi:L,D-transpeptidase [Candidatus Woesebacteria bacterium]|nr:L,D-transpeptidase [Candidatus Woesebacteria bacterium]
MHRLLPLLSFPILLLVFLVFSPALLPKISASAGCANGSDPRTMHDTYNPNLTTAIFEGKTINVPSIADSQASAVLGESVGDKRIEVDLANQRVYAFENANKVFDFLISSGSWYVTPRGNYAIYSKVRSQTMSGGSGAGYYNLPNVPWVMFFYKGYSFHGTYWHNNFGHPMSHGCVNMKIPDSEALFHWAPIGTPVAVY